MLTVFMKTNFFSNKKTPIVDLLLKTMMLSSVLSSDSMHIGLLAVVAHAASTVSCFTTFYNPR